jgi:beta-N-acetylhexosaminidase
MRIINQNKSLLSINFLLIALLFPSDVFSQRRDSLDIKIGQMILIGFPKADVDADVLREVEEGKVGSIIIFEKNIPARNSFAALKKIIWSYQKAAKIPLFIAIS